MVALGREGGEVIPVSQWAEFRRMALVDAVPRREIVQWLGVDVKIVRRAPQSAQAPLKRRSSPRSQRPDPFGGQINRASEVGAQEQREADPPAHPRGCAAGR
jgi:hypothetical protein